MWNICIISKIYVVKYVYVVGKKIYVLEAKNMWFPHKYVASGNPGPKSSINGILIIVMNMKRKV